MNSKSIQSVAGIAAILMVLLQSAAPAAISGIVETIGAPLLFMCMGFALSKVDCERPFHSGIRIFTRFYPVFVRWALFFLVVVTVCGVISPAAFGVASDEHSLLQQVWNILFFMDVEDVPFCNFFWLFRAAVVALVAFSLLHGEMKHSFRKSSATRIAVGIVCVAFFLLVAYTLAPLGNPAFVGGGYRELVAFQFVAIGHLFSCLYADLRPTWHVAVGSAVLLIVVGVLCPVGMSPASGLLEVMALPFSGAAAFLTFSYLSQFLDGESIAERALQFAGRNVHYALAFAMFTIFLLVRVLGIADGSLSDWFLLFWGVGVAVPYVWIWGYRKLERRFDFDLRWSRMVSIDKCKSAAWICWRVIRKFFILLSRFIKAIAIGIKNFALSFVQGLKDVVNASNPKDE